MTPRVTAIVLNWCAESDTAACLESLAASRYDALTVLLVDNGSPDGSGDRLHARFPRVPYLQTGANLGYAGGNNRGIEWAMERGAEYLLVINDDAVVDPDCVARLVSAAEETGAAVAVPRIAYFDEPTRIWYAGGMLSPMRALGTHLRQDERIGSRPETRARVTFACGCCFLARAGVIAKVGAFDESFFAYVEDVELSVRLVKAGYEIVYEPRATVLHRIAPAARETPFQIRQRDRNRRRLVRLHYGPAERVRFAAWFYPTRLIHLIRYAARGEWKEARAVIDGAVGAIDRRDR